MNVVFVFDGKDRTRRVMWEDEESGCVRARLLMSDGAVSEEVVDCSGLYDAMVQYAGPYTPMYPAEVDDLRSAFKYLGKASDLAEMLPEAHVTDLKSNKQAS